MKLNDLMALAIVAITLICLMTQVTSCQIEETKQRQIYLERLRTK